MCHYSQPHVDAVQIQLCTQKYADDGANTSYWLSSFQAAALMNAGI